MKNSERKRGAFMQSFLGRRLGVPSSPGARIARER